MRNLAKVLYTLPLPFETVQVFLNTIHISVGTWLILTAKDTPSVDGLVTWITYIPRLRSHIESNEYNNSDVA